MKKLLVLGSAAVSGGAGGAATRYTEGNGGV